MADNAAAQRAAYAVIFTVSLAVSTAMTMVPVYAERLGADYLMLGLMGAAAALGYTVTTLITGVLLDRYEKVRLYAVFNVAIAASMLAFVLARNVSDLITLRLALGFTTGTFWVSSSAIVADLSPPERLTHSIVIYNLSWMSGMVAGPLLGGLISDNLGFTALFTSMALLVAAGAAIVTFSPLGAVRLRGNPGAMKRDKSPLRPVAWGYVCLFPYALCCGVYFNIVPGHLGKVGFTATTIGLLLTLSNAAKGAGFLGVERLVRWGTRRSLALISVILAAPLLVFAVTTDMATIALALAVYGLGNGLIEPVILNYIAQRAPAESRGLAMGVYETVFGVGSAISPVAAGLISQVWAVGSVYTLLAVVAFATIPLSWWLEEGAGAK
jgi:DHA1 family multidrug resistance protein-like MFS transporter